MQIGSVGPLREQFCGLPRLWIEYHLGISFGGMHHVGYWGRGRPGWHLVGPLIAGVVVYFVCVYFCFDMLSSMLFWFCLDVDMRANVAVAAAPGG